MKTLTQLWDFWNGKKTYVGAVGLFIVYGFEGIGWLQPATADILKGLFLSLGTVGLAHKGVKLRN